MNKLTYPDKVSTIVGVDETKYVTAENMNEIKEVVNELVDRVKTGVAAPTSETKASLTIQTALKLEAKALGTLGNAVTVKAEANTSDNLAIIVTGSDITIKLANATGTKNTMTLIASYIATTPTVNAVVNAIVITGATQMTAFTVHSLSGGANGTAGYDLQVVKDANGTKWEMKYTTAGCYYWSPDGFPANETEYFSHYDPSVGKLVYKARISATIPNSTAANNTYTTAINSSPTHSGLTYSGSADYTTGLSNPLPIAFDTNTTPTILISSFINYSTPKIGVVFKVGASFANKAFRAEITYTK